MTNKIYLGIDIGGTAAKFGIVDSFGNILHKAQYSVSFDGYDTPILDTVLEKSEKFLAVSGFDKISGIGVSATGQIDVEKGIVAGSAGHIKNWIGAKIKESFEKKYSVDTAVINDADSAVLGEKWIGAGKSAENIVAITVGTGIGGGIIVDGNILSGKRGFAGEIGHIVIHGNGEECSCGNRGCFERYGSMTALIRNVKKRYKEDPRLFSVQFNEHIDGRLIFDALEDGNETIKEIVDKWIYDISTGIISLIHIFNPEIVIIGGGISIRKDFIAGIKSGVMDKVMSRFADGLEIVPAALGNDAGLIGAVYYLINKNK